MKIFIVTYGGGHAKIIEKLINELDMYTDISYKLLSLTVASKYFDNIGIHHNTLMDYAPLFNLNNHESQKLIPDYSINSMISQKDHFLYNYLAINDLLLDYNFETVADGLTKFGRRIYLPVHSMIKILKYEKPDCVLVTSSPRMEKSTILAARSLKIPSFSVDDLFGFKRNEDIAIDRFFSTDRYGNTYADYTFVLNEYARDIYLRQGVTTTQIIVTGNPNFEIIVNKNYSRNHLFEIEAYRRSKNKKIITFLAQKTKSYKNIIRKLLLLPEDEYTVIIKLHPNQEKMDIEQSNVIIKNDDLYSCILLSSICITEYSTTGLECLLLGKKLIVVQNEENNNIIPYNIFNNVCIIKDIDQLDRHLLKNNSIYSFQKLDFIHRDDSSKQIIKYIYSKFNQK